MPVNDALGTRMKEFYECVPRTRLIRRMPVAIRIDGKAFHTFTKGFYKPFDAPLGRAMVATMEYLCKNIQGCVFGYTQSDEITLILTDYRYYTSEAWFDYEIQKMCSIAASMATMVFNREFEAATRDFRRWINNCWTCTEQESQLCEAYEKAVKKGAMFDARAFNIPKEEVCNLIYWRQLDATRNSIQMVGQANFPHKELQGKSCSMIQDMLYEKKNINWNNYETRWKRGVAWRKLPNSVGAVDYDMPILKGEDREYVDKCIYFGEGF